MNEFISLRKSIIEKEFSSMNPMQREAVFQIKGPLLIIAGAGSGKTTTMVNRIAYLIRFGNAYHSEEAPFEPDEAELKGLKAYLNGDAPAPGDLDSLLAVDAARPWQILAITFTNKAANELKDRLALLLGDDEAKEIWASTFHACCARILRRFADRIGYSSSFTIYDTDDTKKLVKECQRQLGIDEKYLSFKTISSNISNAKNFLITPAEYERQAEQGLNSANPLIAKAYRLYQSELKKANAMDFDDLIFNTVTLLETDAEVREYYQRKFKYVMVDEYQDTNHAQFRLTQLLADGWGNICVVGDDDQSIYKFRGATIENILNFENQYKNCRVIKLEQNYRSTQTILDAANAVIAHNEGRKGKKLWTNNGQGELITSYLASGQEDEADYIVRTISDNIATGKFRFSDHAVLYRANAQSNAIERAFARAAIPYRIFGGHRFYERAEIRDAIAYLTVLVNPDDNIRLTRIINVPARGIGATTVNNILNLTLQTGRSAFEIISHADEYAVLQRSAGKLRAFAETIVGLQEGIDELPINTVFQNVLEAVGYIEYLEKDREKGQERIENIEELSSNLLTYQDENGEDAALRGFLEEVSLLTDIDNYNDQTDAVVLMTMHSAKGLEFPAVFLPGMEEGVFPGRSAMYDAAEIEEERRLAYVALTRAKKKLYLINCEQRMLYGSTSRNPQSRFLSEIPDRLLERKKSAGLSSFGFGGSTFFDSETRGFGQSFAQSKSRPKRIVPQKQKAERLDLSVGDRVRSRTFGEGTVISARAMGPDTVVEIAFDNVGTKKMMASGAHLEPVNKE